jgi:hypothetical protein
MDSRASCLCAQSQHGTAALKIRSCFVHLRASQSSFLAHKHPTAEHRCICCAAAKWAVLAAAALREQRHELAQDAGGAIALQDQALIGPSTMSLPTPPSVPPQSRCFAPGQPPNRNPRMYTGFIPHAARSLEEPPHWASLATQTGP